MRFYNEKGRCLVCDKAYKSESEIKSHLLYKHLIIVDNKDHDAFHFVEFRVLKTNVIDPRYKLEPNLVCNLCGDGPFIN